MQRALALASILAVCACSPEPSLAQSADAMRQVASIALPNVAGRIDHMAFDPATGRLFVAALGNNTVEVLDTNAGQHVRSLPGFHEPQGIAVIPDLSGVAIANGVTGTLQMLDSGSLQTRWTIPVGGDADNVRYDAANKRVYVAAEGGLFGFDPATGKATDHIGFEGHPESFQLESADLRIFANLPGRGQIVVATRTASTPAARWPMTACAANYPMALDEATSRLFVGCRRPATLATLNTTTGTLAGSTEIVGDTDDLFFDRALNRIYVIGGEGFVDVLDRKGDEMLRLARVPTRAGARTGLFVATARRLYVAVPARDGQPAEIRVMQVPAAR